MNKKEAVMAQVNELENVIHIAQGSQEGSVKWSAFVSIKNRTLDPGLKGQLQQAVDGVVRFKHGMDRLVFKPRVLMALKLYCETRLGELQLVDAPLPVPRKEQPAAPQVERPSFSPVAPKPPEPVESPMEAAVKPGIISPAELPKLSSGKSVDGSPPDEETNQLYEFAYSEYHEGRFTFTTKDMANKYRENGVPLPTRMRDVLARGQNKGFFQRVKPGIWRVMGLPRKWLGL